MEQFLEFGLKNQESNRIGHFEADLPFEPRVLSVSITGTESAFWSFGKISLRGEEKEEKEILPFLQMLFFLRFWKRQFFG